MTYGYGAIVSNRREVEVELCPEVIIGPLVSLRISITGLEAVSRLLYFCKVLVRQFNT